MLKKLHVNGSAENKTLWRSFAAPSLVLAISGFTVGCSSAPEGPLLGEWELNPRSSADVTSSADGSLFGYNEALGVLETDLIHMNSIEVTNSGFSVSFEDEALDCTFTDGFDPSSDIEATIDCSVADSQFSSSLTTQEYEGTNYLVMEGFFLFWTLIFEPKS